MRISSGEKKWLLFSVAAIALPLGVGLFLNRINATPTVQIPAYPPAPKPNGYDLYVAAATAMTPATPPVDPVNDTKIIADPKVRAKRYSLARKTAWLGANAKAFALFDRALQTPTLAPPTRSFNATFPSYGQLRELARQKTIESNARWMRGDYNGALQSNLDTVQMGHDIRHGGALMPTLVGIAIAAIGRGNTGDTIEHLDAAQCKSAARRLEKMLDSRWRLDQVFAEEKAATQASLMEVFRTSDWRTNFFGARPAPLIVLPRFYTTSKQQIIDNVGAIYDRQIANARLPYAQKGAPPLQFSDPFSELFNGSSDRSRVNEARGLTGDRTLMLQLALRAYRLENGVYPPALKTLVPGYLKSVPADAFGGGEAMRYQTDGKTYQLWSIGPDGVDDGGKPIPPRAGQRRAQTVPGERPRGPRSFTDFEGRGDVVAGVNTG